MTTCTIQKFYNVGPLQLSGLMRLIGSEHNNGKTRMRLAYKESDGTFGSSDRAYREFSYRHISLLKATPSEDVSGAFTVEVKVNCFLEPAPGETSDKAEDGWHWSDREDSAPVPVPRSLVLAMHDCLGIFLTE